MREGGREIRDTGTVLYEQIDEKFHVNNKTYLSNGILVYAQAYSSKLTSTSTKFRKV